MSGSAVSLVDNPVGARDVLAGVWGRVVFYLLRGGVIWGRISSRKGVHSKREEGFVLLEVGVSWTP